MLSKLLCITEVLWISAFQCQSLKIFLPNIANGEGAKTIYSILAVSTKLHKYGNMEKCFQINCTLVFHEPDFGEPFQK